MSPSSLALRWLSLITFTSTPGGVGPRSCEHDAICADESRMTSRVAAPFLEANNLKWLRYRTRIINRIAACTAGCTNASPSFYSVPSLSSIPMAAVGINKRMVTDIASQARSLPSDYIRPVSDRPNLLDIENSGAAIPLIDLQGLEGDGRAQAVEAIGRACQTDGFFQVKNHGIPEAVIDGMLRVSKEFFWLPESERLKTYSNDPRKPTRLSTSFNINSEKVSNWRDYLRLHCYPLEEFVHDWPSNPPSFRKVVGEYSKQARELALRLLEAISESLGLERDCMVRALGKQAQHMAINYYPPCPQPELTYGLPSHKDPNAITLLLQDGVSGLQVLRNGKWVAVNPIPNTLIINIGDQMQALSNERYKSVLHRAVVNSKSARISVPTFYCSSPDIVIKPAEGLVDEEHPAVYRSFTYGEYFEKFWGQGLQSTSCLDMFKAT